MQEKHNFSVLAKLTETLILKKSNYILIMQVFFIKIPSILQLKAEESDSESNFRCLTGFFITDTVVVK